MVIDIVPALVKRGARDNILALRQGLHRKAVIGHARVRRLLAVPPREGAVVYEEPEQENNWNHG